MTEETYGLRTHSIMVTVICTVCASEEKCFCFVQATVPNTSVSFHGVMTIFPLPTLAYFFTGLTQQPVVSRAEKGGFRQGQISEPDSVQPFVNDKMETETKPKKEW